MSRAIPIEAFLSGLTDSSGNVLNAGKVYTYEAGGSTPKSVWQDNAQSSAHANPVVLDSQGKKLAYAYGNYKFVIKDSADNTLYTHDNLWFGSEDEPIYWVGTVGGTADALTGSSAVGIGTSIPTGTRVRAIVATTNTTAATFNLNALGAVSIRTRRSQSTTLGANAMRAGEIIELLYDGTYWRLMSGDEGLQSYTPTLTPNNSMTLSGTSSAGKYHVVGSHMFLSVEAAFTVGGTPSTRINISAPTGFTFTTGNPDLHYTRLTDNSALADGVWSFNGANIEVYKSAGGNWTAGAGQISLCVPAYIV